MKQSLSRLAESEHGRQYLTKEQLRECLNLASVRKVEEMMKARMIPYLKLGHKTVRFDLDKVRQALSRYEVEEIK